MAALATQDLAHALFRPKAIPTSGPGAKNMGRLSPSYQVRQLGDTGCNARQAAPQQTFGENFDILSRVAAARDPKMSILDACTYRFSFAVCARQSLIGTRPDCFDIKQTESSVSRRRRNHVSMEL
jgi:hypothetical protein